jgi:hypothetical protein
MDKYLPRFRPEVYLRFLNAMHRREIIFECKFCDEKIYCLESPNVFSDEDSHFYFEGKSIEECLDQAILATGFEKELA